MNQQLSQRRKKKKERRKKKRIKKQTHTLKSGGKKKKKRAKKQNKTKIKAPNFDSSHHARIERELAFARADEGQPRSVQVLMDYRGAPAEQPRRPGPPRA